MKKKFGIIITFIFVFLLAACAKEESEFLATGCQTYNQFIYEVSDDLYGTLFDNGYNFERKNFQDSLVKVKSLTIEKDNPNEAYDLSGIACFPYLTHLELKGESIKDLSPLASLVRLESLVIDDTRVFDLAPLYSMTKLKSLQISNSKTLQNVSGLKNLKRLEEVTLTANGLVDITDLGELTNLEVINLKDNQLKSIASLETLPKLRVLNIEANEIDFDAIDSFEGFAVLEELHAKDNKICKTRPLESFVSLKFLDLSMNNLGGQLGESCSLTEPDFDFISNMPTLETFYAEYNHLTLDHSFDGIDLGQLVELNLSHNDIMTIDSLIGNQTLHTGKLKSLMLSDNQIASVENIHEIQSLTNLELSENAIIEVNDILELSNLITLELANNQISYLPPLTVNGISKMPQVEMIDLSHNSLTHITDLRDHNSLKSIQLNSNYIQTLSNSFVNMPLLEEVVFVDFEEPDYLKPNQMETIEDSFQNSPRLNFVAPGLLTFNFLTSDLTISNSFKEMDQFTQIALKDYSIQDIDANSFDLANVLSVNLSNTDTETTNDNQLTHTTWIKNLPKLTELSASNNLISQVVDNDNAYDTILLLNLSHNRVTSVDFISQFENITRLDLSNNEISLGTNSSVAYQFVTLLSNLDTLEQLNLSNNQITVLNGLTNLDELTLLDLRGNEITEINGLVAIPKLSSLYLDTQSISNIDGLSGLGITEFSIDVITVETLTISSRSLANNHFNGLHLIGKVMPDYQFISNLSYLTFLEIGSSNLEDLSPFEGMTDKSILTDLLLYNNQISQIGPLGSFRYLETLILDDNEITDVSSLRNLTNMRYLSIRSNDVQSIKYSSSTSVFDGMSMLSELLLDENNQMTELVGLNNMTQLKTLLLPGSILTYTNTLNGTTHLNNFNQDYGKTFVVVNENIRITDSFNSPSIEVLIFQGIIGYNHPITNSFGNVKVLNLGNTAYTNIDFVVGFKNLTTLSLQGNSSIPEIDNLSCSTSQLTKLERINLENSQVTSISGSFNNCAALRSVVISKQTSVMNNSFNSTKLVSFAFPVGFNKQLDFQNSFGSLESLDASNTNIRNQLGNVNYEFINNLKNLKSLYMNGVSGVFSGIPVDLTQLSKLEEFYLSYVNINAINNQFNNHPTLKIVYLDNVTVGSIQNSFNSNNRLEEIRFDPTGNVNLIGDSFNNNDLLKTFITTNISFITVTESFNNNPLWASNDLSITSYEDLKISKSFDGNTRMSSLMVFNFMGGSVEIIDSFNQTKINNIYFAYKENVITLSGFGNTDLKVLNTSGYTNLERIEGFSNVKFEVIYLDRNLKLTNLSFLNTIDKQALIGFYVIDISAIQTIQTFINQVVMTSGNKLAALELVNIIPDYETLQLDINQFVTLKISHTALSKVNVSRFLAEKTSEPILNITSPMYTDLSQYVTNQMVLKEPTIRLRITTEVRAEVEEDVRSDLTEATESLIQNEVNERMQEATIINSINDQVNDEIDELIRNQMSKYASM